MKSFSITRIPNNDLIGLLFPPLVSLSEYEIEVIHPEYIEGGYFQSTGTIITDTGYKYSITDCNKYDFVLIPTMSNGFSVYSGLRSDPDSGSLTARSLITHTAANRENSSWWLVGIYNNIGYVCNSISTNVPDLPIIGLKRHRSDNVNPRSPQRPEPIEIRERQESEPEPVPEIAEPEEETPEEVEEE